MKERFRERPQPPRKELAHKDSGWVSYLIGAAVLGLMIPFGWLLRAVGGQSQWLPVSLHSVLAADYSADPYALHLPPLQLGLIAEILNDSSSPTQGAFATLEGNLTSPVPTITPRPGYQTPTLSPTYPPTGTPLPRPGLAASPTPGPGSFTPQPTQGPSLTPTSTLWFFTPTQPVGTVYATRTPQATQPSTPTLAPTATPEPTNTFQPPTYTPLPPTATSTPRPTRTPNPYPGPTNPPPYP